MSAGTTFTAALVQMRSGLSPQANLDAALRLIEEAKSGGADYVLTPEMTNILEIKRERLFAAIAPEEDDASLAAFRELARKLGIFLHVGSLAIKLSAEMDAIELALTDGKRVKGTFNLKVQDGPGGQKFRIPLKPVKKLKFTVEKKSGDSTSTSTSEILVAEKDGKLVIPVPANAK